jgi:hypothetical protein
LPGGLPAICQPKRRATLREIQEIEHRIRKLPATNRTIHVIPKAPANDRGFSFLSPSVAASFHRHDHIGRFLLQIRIITPVACRI